MTTPYYRPPTAPAFGTPFAESYQASRGPESPGLEAQGQRWTAMSQAAATRPTSVLQQLSPSPVAANLWHQANVIACCPTASFSTTCPTAPARTRPRTSSSFGWRTHGAWNDQRQPTSSGHQTATIRLVRGRFGRLTCRAGIDLDGDQSLHHYVAPGTVSHALGYEHVPLTHARSEGSASASNSRNFGSFGAANEPSVTNKIGK